MNSADEEYTVDEMYKLGMDCLVDKFGIVNTEKFITAVRSRNPDYTEWRQQMYEGMTVEEFDASVDDFAKSHGKEKSKSKD